MTGTPKLCPKCHQPMSYALQPGGKPPRTWRCLECEMPDPLTSPELKALMNGLLKHASQ
ncbi:hypothetical protein ACVIW2_008398 [Bradyrhizobium huanghuaihaiense]|uniref:Uncharacterized protein n=1 Tax=Bradyrhizobium huanghuaihaiense TaxID=990078 RepID=A0A562QX04_9BRAD|nr:MULTISPECIES: hypothetical protein [Bradyrhizobium]TWI61339.1 hypothetical protein IQ16_07217 [Bradyrhizobium huanghuaihaiense]UWU77885.1 hypothetical protein N2603_05305 [Bradyrhizobium sp. CB3035]